MRFLSNWFISISCKFLLLRLSPAVAEVIDKDTPAMFGPESVAKRNEAFIQEAKGGSLLACFVGEYNHPTVGHFGINILNHFTTKLIGRQPVHQCITCH